MSIFMQSRKVLRGLLSDIFLDKVQLCRKILQQISMENNFKFYKKKVHDYLYDKLS